MGRSQQVVYLTTIGCPSIRNCGIKHGWDGRCEQVTGSAHSFHVRPLVLDEAPHDLCLAAFQPAHLSHALHSALCQSQLCKLAVLKLVTAENGHGCQDMKVMVSHPHTQHQDLRHHDRIKLQTDAYVGHKKTSDILSELQAPSGSICRAGGLGQT